MQWSSRATHRGSGCLVRGERTEWVAKGPEYRNLNCLHCSGHCHSTPIFKDRREMPRGDDDSVVVYPGCLRVTSDGKRCARLRWRNCSFSGVACLHVASPSGWTALFPLTRSRTGGGPSCRPVPRTLICIRLARVTRRFDYYRAIFADHSPRRRLVYEGISTQALSYGRQRGSKCPKRPGVLVDCLQHNSWEDPYAMQEPFWCLPSPGAGASGAGPRSHRESRKSVRPSHCET